jgi:type II secretory pathway component PulK
MQAAVTLEVDIETAQARLLHTLLTNTRYIKQTSENKLVKEWNFYNEPFSLGPNVTVKIQDLKGLLNVNMMSKELATRVFAKLGLEGHPVRTFLDSLRDWIDVDDFKFLNGAEKSYYRSQQLPGPRNGYLQSLNEVLAVKMGNILPMEVWRLYFTEKPVGGFNPLTAPNLILAALIQDDSITQEVIRLRNTNQLTYFKFYQLTFIDGDEYYNFATSNKLRVELLAKSGNTQVKKQFVVEVNPYDYKRTVIITDVIWN